jgi:hypothetical protein
MIQTFYTNTLSTFARQTIRILVSWFDYRVEWKTVNIVNIKTMFGSFYLQLFVGGIMSYLILYVFTHT